MREGTVSTVAPSEEATSPDSRLLYRSMRRIRRFEEEASALYRAAEVPGFVHLCTGQEAVAVGICAALAGDDYITSTHRGHGHSLAKGASMEAMFAELMGRESGTCRGMGGSMHIADPRLGILGANGIVGAGLPIAAGAGVSIKMRRTQQVVAAFFGDGAVSTGAFHEAVNLISLWNLPVLLVCENNQFAEFSLAAEQHPASLSQRAAGYGLRYESVDGNDVIAVWEVAMRLVAEIRRGERPVLLEAKTLRLSGHYEGDPQRYRVDEAREVSADPLARAESILLAGHDGVAVLTAVVDEVESEIQSSVDRARAAAYPDVSLLTALMPLSQGIGEDPDFSGDVVSEVRYSQAIRAALNDALDEDQAVMIAGIDVASGGGVFGITRGLKEQFPGRIVDTPIAETAIVGLGVGAAMTGLRPIVELMYLDFIGVCLDQVLNQAAKMHFMTGGAVNVPLVLRTQFGVGRSSGSQHSQSLEALLAHIPGLVVAMPSTPRDAYGLLRSAIDAPSPVIFIENRLLYETKGPSPEPGLRIPLGRASVVVEGTDITIVAVSRAVRTCVEAARALISEGISCEVVDLRTVAPLDWETVGSSLTKTNRMLVVTEAVSDFGVGAEIAARSVDQGFWDLDAPVRRLGGMRTPVPYSPPLESAWVPSVNDVIGEVRQLCADR